MNALKKEGYPFYIIVGRYDNIINFMNKFSLYQKIFEDKEFLLFARNDVIKDKYIKPADDEKYYTDNLFSKLN